MQKKSKIKEHKSHLISPNILIDKPSDISFQNFCDRPGLELKEYFFKQKRDYF